MMRARSSRNFLGQVVKSDVALLSAATGIAQISALAVLPYLTTLYSPEQFGVYAGMLSGVGLLSAPLFLRFDAVLQIAHERDNQRIITAALVVGLGLCCAFSVFGGVFVAAYPTQNTNDGFSKLFFLVVPLGALFTAVLNLGRQYLAKQRKFLCLATSQVVRTAAVLAVQCLPLFSTFGLTGLLAGFFTGLWLGCWIVWPLRGGMESLVCGVRESGQCILYVLRRYGKFVAVDTFNIVVSAIAILSLPIVIMWQFGDGAAGLYSLASRLTLLPVEIFAGAIATVFFQRASAAVRSGRGILPLFYRVLVGSIILGVIFSALIGFIAPIFMRYFLTQRWQPAIDIVVCLIPFFLTRFVVGVLANTALVLQRPQLQTGWNLCQIAVLGVAFWHTAERGVRDFLWLGGCGLLVCGLGYIFALLFAIKAEERSRITDYATRLSEDLL